MFLDVFEDSAAARSGVRPGYLLVSVNGVPAAPPEYPTLCFGAEHHLTIQAPNDAATQDVTVPEFDRLLIAGIKHGPAMKKEAINRVLRLAPHRLAVTVGIVSDICARLPDSTLVRASPGQGKEIGETYPEPALVRGAVDTGAR